jgi:hypothetical protein
MKRKSQKAGKVIRLYPREPPLTPKINGSLPNARKPRQLKISITIKINYNGKQSS